MNDLNAFLSAQRNFLSTYQEVSVDKDQLFFSFRMSAVELNAFRFFQDITPVSMITDGIAPLTHFNKLRNALTPYFSVHYFDDNRDFDLALPYQDSNMTIPIPMTEAVSIYAIMFYLSSLVRYRPDYLESLLNYKPAWLIESFVNCTPETFLRIMVCKIIKKDYLFRQR